MVAKYLVRVVFSTFIAVVLFAASLLGFRYMDYRSGQKTSGTFTVSLKTRLWDNSSISDVPQWKVCFLIRKETTCSNVSKQLYDQIDTGQEVSVDFIIGGISKKPTIRHIN
jgi:hypothetical protein